MENVCEWKNCKKLGKYKAPISKDEVQKYRMLCEDHIKKFNKDWDYFRGMSQNEIENFIKSDMNWHRPTQNFSTQNNFYNILWNNAINDKFNVFGNKTNIKFPKNANLSLKDKEAFELLDLDYTSDWQSIQKKFKKLVKKYHPDMNPDNKKFENKLKSITLAYTQLKKSMMKKNV